MHRPPFACGRRRSGGLCAKKVLRSCVCYPAFIGKGRGPAGGIVSPRPLAVHRELGTHAKECNSSRNATVRRRNRQALHADRHDLL